MQASKNLLVDKYLADHLTQEQLNQLHVSIDAEGNIQGWPTELLEQPSDEVLESLRAGVESALDRKNFTLDCIQVGQTSVYHCANVLNFIRGFNMQAGRTKSQRDQMASAFSVIKELLEDGRTEDALELIQAVIPDGELVTQEMKDIVVGLLQEGL